MRTSKYFFCTLKETPSNAEIISHQLMLRAGMIRQLASGLYYWLPTGIRVLNKLKNIIYEEMNCIGALEVSMPIVQPSNLWKKSGRWEKYGVELLRFLDRNQRSFILGPTHEEISINLVCNEINSYNQLPLTIYQIQTKFRDELRPRFGVIRSREFIMKDAYSFHINQNCLQKTYEQMFITYKTIFNRINLNFRVVQANNGNIGGIYSHEFQALTSNGEDRIVLSTQTDYASNIELAEAICITKLMQPTENMRLINTSHVKNINDLIKYYNISIKKIIKTLFVYASKKSNHKIIALLIRADHELNEIKAAKHPLVNNPLQYVNNKDISCLLNSNEFSWGPINLPMPIIVDHSVAVMSDFVAGANINEKHYFGINWNKDIPLTNVYDLRNVVNGDPSPDGKGVLRIQRGIEVGHLFQLGTQYSDIINFTVKNQKKENKTVLIGCYGIGITRLIAAIIEQNYDNKGIIWPDIIAPFQVAILPLNMYKSYYVKKIAEQLYLDLQINGIDVFLDDRNEQLGVMFSDMDLIGVSHMIIISERNLKNKKIEYKHRRNVEKKFIHLSDIINFFKKILNKS